MAVYGIGAYFNEDVSKDFIEASCACIGYGKSEASSLYEMLRRVKLGDIIYIKSFTIQGRTVNIKAIGFVTGTNIKNYEFPNGEGSMGYGREVVWKKEYNNKDEWLRVKISDEDIKNNVYNNTMYEEYSIEVIEKILGEFPKF